MTRLPASDPHLGERVDLARRVAGTSSARGNPLAIVHAKGEPRWIVERRVGGRGPLRTGVWRPALRRSLFAAVALEIGAATGRIGEAIRVDPERGLAHWLGEQLGLPDLRLGGVQIPPRAHSRTIVSLYSGDRLAFFAKVVAEPALMEREQRVLEAISRVQPRSFVVPEPVGLFTWDDLAVLVLEPLALQGVAVRRFGDAEVEMLAELATLREPLADVLGRQEGRVPVHGDFVPWNTGRTPSGYAAWDWEMARVGGPLSDFFHWHVQLAIRLADDRIDELVRLARTPSGPLDALLDRLELDRELPTEALTEYLRVRLERAPDIPRVKVLLRRGLALLGESEATPVST